MRKEDSPPDYLYVLFDLISCLGLFVATSLVLLHVVGLDRAFYSAIYPFLLLFSMYIALRHLYRVNRTVVEIIWRAS